MHAEAYAFVQSAVADLPMKGRRILEIGSYTVNGSIRPLFGGAKEYVGIDMTAGPDVDIVSSAVDYDGKGAFDLAVSCEAMEHSPDPADIVLCAWAALKPGGALIITAAGENRTPHNCDGSPYRGIEPYTNITRAMLRKLLSAWADVSIHEASGPRDVYATAIKPQPTKE